MVVGHDVAVGRDDDTRTSRSALGSLHLALALTAVALSAPEETTERVGEEILKRVAVFHRLCL